MQRVLDWGATLVLLPVFGMTLLLFDVIQRVAKLFGKRAHDWAVAWMCSTLVFIFRIVGTRITIEGGAAITPRTSYLIVANHQSMFDIALLGHVFFSNFPKFVSKRELARGIPSVAYNLRYGGNALIDRADGTQARTAITALGHRVERNGVSAVIFPEGTRARAGMLGIFKPRGTAALLAAAPSTPIVTGTIEHSWKLMRWNFLSVPFGVRVRMRIDAPITRTPDEDHGQIVRDLWSRIARNLADMRGLPAVPVGTMRRAS